MLNRLSLQQQACLCRNVAKIGNAKSLSKQIECVAKRDMQDIESPAALRKRQYAGL